MAFAGEATSLRTVQFLAQMHPTNELAGTWGKAHACGVTHQTPNPEVFQSDKAFNDIANRLLTKEMTPVPE